jgi:hemolysin D
MRKTLYDHSTGSKANYLELLQPFVEEQQELQVQKSKINEADSGLAAIIEERAHTDAEYRRERFGELVEAERKARGLRDDVVKAQHRTRLQELVAPVAGTVEQLSIHTIGGVVTPAQTLMVIVPDGSKLEVEAMLPNRDAGFVHAGQPAELKIEAFTYTRYGLLHGQVRTVSRDALRNERDALSSDRDQASSKSSPQDTRAPTEESAYVARISLAESEVQTEQGPVPLAPGMTVTAEIKTGQRRIIEYLLSPFMRYRHDVLRER